MKTVKIHPPVGIRCEGTWYDVFYGVQRPIIEALYRFATPINNEVSMLEPEFILVGFAFEFMMMVLGYEAD